MDDQFEKLVQILGKSERLFEDIEFLIYYLQRYEEIKRFFSNLNTVVIASLCRQFTISINKKNEKIHEQDVEPNEYYLILRGSISLFDGSKLLNKISTGKAIGEREIMKDAVFPHTGICSTPLCYLLKLTKADFIEALGETVSLEYSKKLQYVKMLLPNFSKLSQTLQERLIQGLRIEKYNKGETVSKKGVIEDYLLLIVKGDCALVTNIGYFNKEIVTVSKGSTYAEECVLHGIPTEYALVAKCPCRVVFVKKNDVLSIFPDSIMKLLRNNYECKKIQRNKVLDYSPKNETEDNDFPLASRYARRKLSEVASRSNKLSPNRLLDFNNKAFINFKNQLTFMRDSSPKRIIIPTLRGSINKSFDFEKLSSTFN